MIIFKEESKRVRDIIMFVSALYIFFFFFLLFPKGRELLKIKVVTKVGCYLKDDLILLI